MVLCSSHVSDHASLWATQYEVQLLDMVFTNAVQELEQAGIKPLACLPERTDAGLVDVEAASILSQLTCGSSTSPMHLVLLELRLETVLGAMAVISMHIVMQITGRLDCFMRRLT